MRITCPHCGFAKELADAQIPANVVRVTCPTCRQPFSLERPVVTAPVELMAQDMTSDAVHADATVRTETVAESGAVTDPASNELTEPADAEPRSGEPVEPACGERAEPIEPAEPAYGEPAEPATIGSRYAALLIDIMLIMIMVLILRAGLTLLGNGIPLAGQIILGASFMLFALTLGFAYHTLFIGVCGQTPGKMLLRIRVIAADNSVMTYRQAMLREVLGKTLSLPLLLGYLMAMFNPQHLAAHDKIANTCVVKLITEATVD